MAESTSNRPALGTSDGNRDTESSVSKSGPQTKEVPSSARSSRLTTLPPELQLMIFKLLDNVTSSCLGLTCKKFYGIHYNRHGIVSLSGFTSYRGKPLQLGTLLLSWAGPSFVYHRRKPYVFVKRVRYPSYIQELYANQLRQDRIDQRVAELTLINWEAGLFCRELNARQTGTWSSIFVREWNWWERGCEKAVNMGFDLTWLYKPAEFPLPTTG